MRLHMAERLTPLQKEEVELALCRLSSEGIDLIRGNRLNYLQMRQIRQGLERGLSVDQVRPVARRWIDHTEMKELLSAIEAGESVTIPRRPKKVLPAVLITALFLLTAGAGYSYFSQTTAELTVPLVQKEIRLSTGMVFEPEKYVKRDLLPGDAVLVLPESFSCVVPQVRLAVYRVKQGERTVDAILRIEVVDETAPVLRLQQSEVTLGEDDVFSCALYIAQAEDDVDGDLRNRVICSDELRPQYDQEVHYELKDQAGNTTTAFLLVFQEAYAKSDEAVNRQEMTAAAETTNNEETIPEETLNPHPAADPSAFTSGEVTEEKEVIISETVDIESSDVIVDHDVSF